MQDELIEDWNKLISNNLQTTDFVNKHWENFVWLYVSIFLERDDADLIVLLNNILEKILKMDVIPIFEDRKQFSQYIKVSLINKNRLRKTKEKLIENSTQDFDDVDFTEIFENPKGNSILRMDMLITDLESMLTENQLNIVMLLLKGYTRNKISTLLGLSLSAVNNRIYHIQEKIKNYLNI